MRCVLLLLSLLCGARARAEAPSPDPAACKAAARMGSPSQVALPTLDEGADPTEAVEAWRDQLVTAYGGCGLAPFEAHAIDLREHGLAYAPVLKRSVGRYALKPEGVIPAGLERGLEIVDLAVRGNLPEILKLLAPLQAMKPWPVRTSGEVITGCRLELAQTHRAELCLDIDDVDRAEESVVSTHARIVAVCPKPLRADEIALVWLTPLSPAAMKPVRSEAATAGPLGEAFTTQEEGERELACSEDRAWCVELTAHGGLTLTHDEEPTAATTGDLRGFSLVGAPAGGWSGIEHLPSGVRVARSAIGSFHGLPGAAQTQWWLASGKCMLWRLRLPGPRVYAARVELGVLCQMDGVWRDGLRTAGTSRSRARTVVQTAPPDNVATRCRYTP